MRNDHRTVRTSAAAPRPLLALVLAVCLLVSALPTAWASSVGSGPSSLTRSTAPTYVKLSRSVLIFQGDTYGSGVSLTLPAGTVCQLYSENYYTASDGLQYYSLYYLNTRYNVLRTDIQGDIMTAAETETYITGTLWKQTNYSTLRERDGLVGDIRVHAVQLALSRLGYYTGALDGDYGEKTNEAMKQFQRKNGLKVDGAVGESTAAALGITLTGSVSAASYNESETYLLGRLVHGEARGEPYVGKVAVAAVVLNRVKSPSFPNTISGVIYQSGAFDAVSDGQINLTPDEESLRAARDALNGWDPTGGCLYYYNPATATNGWIWSRTVQLSIGKHNFAI